MKSTSGNMIDLSSTAKQPSGTGTSTEATLAASRPPSHPLQPLNQSQQQLPSAVAADVNKPATAITGSLRDADRQANWLVGVEPQDVRYPVNIVQLAFTANYFGALTSDRRKIYVNRRVPGWRGNCKCRCIEFPPNHRPSSIVSFNHQEKICVVFRRRIEFHCLETVSRVGVYKANRVEVAAAGARGGQSPLGALWCSPGTPPVDRPTASDAASELPAAFTVWTDQTDAPHRTLLLGSTAVGHPERFLCFYWTSEDTVLLVSRQEASSQMVSSAQNPQRYQLQQQQQQQTPVPLHQQQPLVFCAYDTSGRRPLQRLCRRSVHSARQFCLSPDGHLLLLSGGSSHQLLESTTLRKLLVLPRRQATTVSTPLPMALSNAGDLILLQMADLSSGGAALEIHRRIGGAAQGARYELSQLLGCTGTGDCRVYAVGEVGALVVFEQAPGVSHEAEGDRPGQQSQSQPSQQPQPQVAQGRSVVALVDLSGNVIMRAEWPRSRVHLVCDDLLVYLMRLSAKPFSAAHACIFDFNSPPSRRSHWSATAALAISKEVTGSRPARSYRGDLIASKRKTLDVLGRKASE